MAAFPRTLLRGFPRIFRRDATPVDRIEGRLLWLAVLFLVTYALSLTISPAVRARSWQIDYRWAHWLGLCAWLFVMALIHRRLSSALPRRDPFLLPVAGLLSGWGLLTIWRLIPALGTRQSLWILISGLVLLAGLWLQSDLGFLRRYKYVWLVSSLTLTAATLIFGTNPLGYGPRMWLGCCGVYLQPSEPLKLLFIAYLAAYMADREPFLAITRLRTESVQPGRSPIDPWRAFSLPFLPLIAPTLIVVGMALALLIIQRDLGTASIFFFLFAAIVFSASGHRGFLWATVLTLVLASIIGYISFDIVRLRVDAWLNPWIDPSGRSYQVVQSLIALAAGGLFGRGPGVGNPGLVPVAHSDLIYAAIVEESGLVGAIGLLVLLGLLVARGLKIALRASNSYHRYLAAGLTVYLVGQSLLIIGGSLRILPLTGVTLPFVSYGGSSLLTSFLSLLLLLHISQNANQIPTPTLSPRLAKSYFHIAVFLLLGVVFAALATGWWSVYRSLDLLSRTDNPRRAIADRSVLRGSLLDRQGKPLQVTVGRPGDYTRLSLHSELGNVIGYINPVYGQSGLEASLDDTLRGLVGNPPTLVWWNALLYGQPPPGLDVRLTLNLELQNRADQLLAGKIASLVLIDAQQGEIFVMSSHPTFDPNSLEENWEILVEDPASPLINRATQGQYPVGAALGPLLYAKNLDESGLPALPLEMDYRVGGQKLGCAHSGEHTSWAEAIADGCPGAVAALGENLGIEQLVAYYHSLGFYAPPLLRMPVAEVSSPEEIQMASSAALGENLQLSPLQLVLAAASLSAQGVRPAPIIALATNIPERGWGKMQTLDAPHPVLSAGSASRAVQQLTLEEDGVWGSVSVVPRGSRGALTWFLGGISSTSPERAYTLVLLLEEDHPDLAIQIGREMLNIVNSP